MKRAASGWEAALMEQASDGVRLEFNPGANQHVVAFVLQFGGNGDGRCANVDKLVVAIKLFFGGAEVAVADIQGYPRVQGDLQADAGLVGKGGGIVFIVEATGNT